MASDSSFPATIGRYVVQRVLGEGAMGSVLLAEDPRIKRKVAIKVVKMDAIRNDKDRVEFLARFEREAEVSGLLNHPGIVTIYDVGEQEGVGPFLAMEFVPGRPLDALIKEGAPISIREKLRIAAALAEALDHAHELGVVHRDVKPGNVMLSEDGRPKLMDFGIAKREDAGLTQTGTFLGTPSYASPEQIKEGTVDARSDIFSFGVMIFELMSGQSPFPGTSINTILYRIVNEPPKAVEPPVTGILPDGWARVFNKVLAKKAEDRHPSCAAFVRDLMDAATDIEKNDRREVLGILKMSGEPQMPELASKSFDETLMVPLEAPRSRTGLWVGLGGVAVALAAGGFILMGRMAGTPVLIKTDPDKAKVTINGQAVADPTPTQQRMKPGAAVHLEAKGFEPADLVFESADSWKPVISLKAIETPVQIVTNPEGATVVVDGVTLGASPQVLIWNQGKVHQITLTKDQFAPFNKDFQPGDFPAKGQVFQLQAAAGGESANVVTAPADPKAPGVLRISGGFSVHVKVDGADKGEVAKLDLPAGAHKVELSNPKVFYTGSHSVTVEGGKDARITLPGLATLTFNTHPGVGDVSVDGRATGVQSDGGAVKVAFGRHTITIRSASGNMARDTVEVDGDKSVDLKL
jgi:serine/threonine protein kinase